MFLTKTWNDCIIQPGSLATSSNDKLIENYVKSKNSLGVILEFIGGEPLLEIDLID